jgi:hypothetical protein
MPGRIVAIDLGQRSPPLSAGIAGDRVTGRYAIGGSHLASLRPGA